MDPNPIDALVAFMSKSIVSVGIIYAWTYSYNRPSKFRGGGAQNMKEEFSAYGLPSWIVPIVRIVKLTLAVCLLAGFFIPILVKPVAAILAFIMFVAVLMHLKIRKDSLFKAFPAYLILCCTIFLVLD